VRNGGDALADANSLVCIIHYNRDLAEAIYVVYKRARGYKRKVRSVIIQLSANVRAQVVGLDTFRFERLEHRDDKDSTLSTSGVQVVAPMFQYRANPGA